MSDQGTKNYKYRKHVLYPQNEKGDKRRGWVTFTSPAAGEIDPEKESYCIL